uniref:Uncharacterized protein n=1 Tax=Setaria italica TaxID=4555 RepID=K3YBK5_SETIT
MSLNKMLYCFNHKLYEPEDKMISMSCTSLGWLSCTTMAIVACEELCDIYVGSGVHP